jgi:hypothetical protein
MGSSDGSGLEENHNGSWGLPDFFQFFIYWNNYLPSV